MAILKNIKRVDITELDPATGAVKSETPIKKTIKTAEEAELKALISEGGEDILRTDDLILAIVRTPDLLYGYDVTFKDNEFDETVAGLVQGYKVTKTGSSSDGSEKIKLSTPMMSEGNMAKPFKMEIYVGNYSGDSLVNYVKITLNKCEGKFSDMKIGKEFFSPEFNIKARENTKAKLPTQEIDFIDKLPDELV